MSEFTKNPKNRRRGALLVVIIIVALIAYHFMHKKPPAAPPMQAAPVTVQTLKSQTIRTSNEFSGRMKAVDSAEIRPEVSGRIIEVKFKDGQLVKKGDVLFVIEPRPFEAAVAKAEADLASAKTNAEFAKTEVGRAEKMLQSQAIARRLYDERANANRVAGSNIKSAEAALKNAQVDLERAHVRAPISGRAGRVELTAGNIVQAGLNAPLLTTIVSNDGIYADFEVDEATYMAAVRANGEGLADEQKIPVELTARGDKEHSYLGTIYTFDNQIDPSSGTIRARAKFANKDNALVPGMFVMVKVSSAKESQVIMVPEGAISTDQDKKYVYVIGDGNKAQYREIVLGQAIEGKRIVLSGLKESEKIIVDGTQHVRPDAVVAPEEEGAAQAGGKVAEATPTQPSPLKGGGQRRGLGVSENEPKTSPYLKKTISSSDDALVGTTADLQQQKMILETAKTVVEENNKNPKNPKVNLKDINKDLDQNKQDIEKVKNQPKPKVYEE